MGFWVFSTALPLLLGFQLYAKKFSRIQFRLYATNFPGGRLRFLMHPRRGAAEAPSLRGPLHGRHPSPQLADDPCCRLFFSVFLLARATWLKCDPKNTEKGQKVSSLRKRSRRGSSKLLAFLRSGRLFSINVDDFHLKKS